jgi:hypothetical protein
MVAEVNSIEVKHYLECFCLSLCLVPMVFYTLSAVMQAKESVKPYMGKLAHEGFFPQCIKQNKQIFLAPWEITGPQSSDEFLDRIFTLYSKFSLSTTPPHSSFRSGHLHSISH